MKRAKNRGDATYTPNSYRVRVSEASRFVLLTTGSKIYSVRTGKPKGIANSHRAAVRSYLWRFGVSANGPGDWVGCNVFFIWEMLRPLLKGAMTVVMPDDAIYDRDA